MKSRSILLSTAMMLGLASANAIPDPRVQRTGRIEVSQTKRQKKRNSLAWQHWVSPVNPEIEKWNKAVDEKNGLRHMRRLAKHEAKGYGPDKSEPVMGKAERRVKCATSIRDLIWNYQVHSRYLTDNFNVQRAHEFARRSGGRTMPAVKREAEFAHKARNSFTARVSAMIGGRTNRVILQLAETQQGRIEARRAASWGMWTPIDNGIWQYHAHDELFPYFMFNDESGELFEFDPAVLHFKSAQDCERALLLYVAGVNAANGPQRKEAEDAFKAFCEEFGGRLVDVDAAGDETYALESK